jgi:hypothetical protein
MVADSVITRSSVIAVVVVSGSVVVSSAAVVVGRGDTVTVTVLCGADTLPLLARHT